MQISGGNSVEPEEVSDEALVRCMRDIHLDAVSAAIAEVNGLSVSDPTRHERLLELSRKQMALQRT